MAKGSKGSKSSGGVTGPKGGIKGAIASFFSLIIVIGLVLAFVRVNDIHSAGDALSYARTWSARIDSCGYYETIRGRCVFDGRGFKVGDAGGSQQSSGTQSGSTPTAPGGSVQQPDGHNGDTKQSLKDVLNTVPVKDSDNNASYSRKDWKHWVGTPCNTRKTVLINQGVGVTTGANCRIMSGKWTDPYSGVEMNDAKKIDIDHVIPLKWANNNGGSQWDAKTKEAFANDTTQLLAVSAKENRAKGALGPGDYMPPNKEFTCEYSTVWVNTLKKYNLSIPLKDKDALMEGLNSCD